MKVVAAKEMGRIEALAYEAGALETTFMAAAGKGVAEHAHKFVAENRVEWSVLLLCGKGNNAGDAYVAGCELIHRGYQVRALQLGALEQASPLCQENAALFAAKGGECVAVATPEQLTFFSEGIILDGIFGTGFHGSVSGLFAAAITKANATGLPILAIDIPSGVDGNTGAVVSLAIQASVTVYLGMPKTGLFIGEGWSYVGAPRFVDFGLDASFIQQAKADLLLLQHRQAALLLPKLARSRHKYQAGYVVGLAGSLQMPGAAILSGLAALRGGAGIVRMLYSALTPRPPFPAEVLAQPYSSSEDVLKAMNQAAAVFIGPGLGSTKEAFSLLERVLRTLQKPCVIDADGLNLLAQSCGWALPEHTILTPHIGEMRRLLHLEKEETPKGMDWLTACQLYACSRRVTLVVKGSPSYIFDPSGKDPATVVARGDPGMATAGCGDVLTGLLAALLAQGMHPTEAACLGVYLHALAGEAAGAARTSYSMVASDVTEHLTEAFGQLMRCL